MGNCVINFKGETFETDAKGLKAFAAAVSKQLPVHVAAGNQPIPVPVNPIETRQINSATLTSAPEVIQNAKYVVIDTETSGLKSNAVSGRTARVSYDADEILQVSWLIMDANGKVLDRKTFIPTEAKERFKGATEIPNTNVHKIRPEHLDSATFSILDAYTTLEELKNAGVTFVGQNINFDVRMLEGAFERNSGRNVVYTSIFNADNIIDTITLPGVKNKNFKRLEDLVNIPTGAHNASYDVEATSWLFISQSPELNKQRSDIYTGANGQVQSVQKVEFFDFEKPYTKSTQSNNKADEIKADIEKLEKEKREEFDNQITIDELFKQGNVINYNGRKVTIDKVVNRVVYTKEEILNVDGQDADNYLLYQNGKKSKKEISAKYDAQIAQKQAELTALESKQKVTPQKETIESENAVVINLPTADSQYDLTPYENKTIYLLHPGLNTSGMQVINPKTSNEIINAISSTNPNIENPELNRVSTNLDLAAEDVILNAKLNTATTLEFFESLQANYSKLLDAVLDQNTLEHLQKILVRAALVELGVEEDISITDDYISILTKYDDQLEDPSIDPLRNLFARKFNPTCN